jgi:O-antigen/teichoic acid export membrane protein
VVKALGPEGRTAISNLAWKAISLPLEKGCRVLLVALAGRALGDAAFGRYQFAMTLTGMLALSTDLGLGIWTTRALARSRARGATVVRTALGVRTMVVPPYVLITLLAARIVGAGEMRAAFLLLGVAALAGAYADHFAAVLRGYERLDDEAWLNVARAVLLVGAGLLGLALRRTLGGLAAGVAAGSLLACGYGFWMLRHRYDMHGAFDRALAREAVREAVPLWLASLVSLLYFRGDVLLLRPLAGDAELGAYSAAYQLFDGTRIFPAILLAAFFPPLARAHGDRERQRRWERLTVTVLLGAGAAVGAILCGGARPIIALVNGPSFARAVASARVLGLAVPLLYLNFGLTHFLIARDLGRRNMVFGALMLVVNVSINLIVIPRFGGPGAAWATGATELSLTLCCLAALGWLLPAATRPPPAPSTASRARTSG